MCAWRKFMVLSKNSIDEKIVFFDLEVDVKTKKICDIGAVRSDKQFHSQNMNDFINFVENFDFLCGHNIIQHDLKYVKDKIDTDDCYVIDTLFLSPLLFPHKPYHALVKDDKLQVDQLNNPLNDSIKARDLFFDEVNAFYDLSFVQQRIYRSLLENTDQFRGFFKFVDSQVSYNLESDIKNEFKNKICQHADIKGLIEKCPIELAYALAIIGVDDKHSLTPPWVHMNFPLIENVMNVLRNTSCSDCEYCDTNLNIRSKLKQIFDYDEFRTYNDEPLQERATQAAVDGKSLLAIFPTGGGKSLAFQLPALIAGESSKALTVVISPLQSLMKDQVDGLSKKGIVDAVAINGLLTPLERAEAIERVSNGLASILYISPESLRSKTIEKLLLSRNIARFVIDEAHCFSAWGQDFRVDYMYIGDFIRQLKKKKGIDHDIPVSCFTATAKQKVISDICEYFKEKLGINLELYTTGATRKNLQYVVLYKEDENEKYIALRNLIEEKNCPTIVYVSRTRRTFELAEKLTRDGFPAKAFNGKMEINEKISNQDAFINNDVKVMVATSAFGMGVDKQDVGLVVHYEISDSLENYIQEAGRAGRDQKISAECYVLFNNNDLDKHFILLNQTKLSISEIQQVWKAIKDLTRFSDNICRSALEIARQAGWDDSKNEIETRVKTALAALERAGFIERGKNIPRVYASSILVDNMSQAVEIIDKSEKIVGEQKQNSKRIIKLLISKRSKANAMNEEAESRVDYISDILGIDKKEVVACINLMREEKILDDSMDLILRIRQSENKNKVNNILIQYIQIERFLLKQIEYGLTDFNYKELNDKALKEGITFCSPQKLKTIFYYWTISGFIQKQIEIHESRTLELLVPVDKIEEDIDRRVDLSKFIVSYLFNKYYKTHSNEENVAINFSILELQKAYSNNISLFSNGNATADEMQHALLYLSKINALSLEGGFLIIYNSMEIHRIIKDNKIKFKHENYKMLDEFYKQKIQQIHIVGEFAKIMVRSYEDALQFVSDYFQMNYKQFLSKYFKGNRMGEINRNITPEKYRQLFGELSKTQSDIINDDSSQYIVVAAGPGSGKTKVLVHKLASLLLMEDVKHEQLLMLTFSRAAASEFKSRLIKLIGNAAHFVEIKTFHSYCFDLLGRIGNIEDFADIVSKATEMINNGEVEAGKITKSVLVIDEAQDMDKNEYALLSALMRANEEMRIIAVGDDDQNIFEFRGSSSEYLNKLIENHGAKKYELIDNYRSARSVVNFSNQFVKKIKNRMKKGSVRTISNDEGYVKLVKHTNSEYSTAVVDELIKDKNFVSTCILTGTNEDAVEITGILTQKGIKAKLIQTNEGFNLSNLAEIRYFLFLIDLYSKTPIIDNNDWDVAISRLKTRYEDSSCLQDCLNILAKFCENNRTKYKTDLEEFIYETNYNDYVNYDRETIIVSTIHKAKGKEFDNVYMMLENYKFFDDEDRRPIYVGITRAKKSLHIHYDGQEFDEFKDTVSEYVVDTKRYGKPNEIVVQLSYKDVYLDYFKNKKHIIKDLVSGESLNIAGDYLTVSFESEQKPILKFSQSFQTSIKSFWDLGYEMSEARIRFIVAWRGENDQEDTMVVLPDIKFEWKLY